MKFVIAMSNRMILSLTLNYLSTHTLDLVSCHCKCELVFSLMHLADLTANRDIRPQADYRRHSVSGFQFGDVLRRKPKFLLSYNISNLL